MIPFRRKSELVRAAGLGGLILICLRLEFGKELSRAVAVVFGAHSLRRPSGQEHQERLLNALVEEFKAEFHNLAVYWVSGSYTDRVWDNLVNDLVNMLVLHTAEGVIRERSRVGNSCFERQMQYILHPVSQIDELQWQHPKLEITRTLDPYQTPLLNQIATDNDQSIGICEGILETHYGTQICASCDVQEYEQQVQASLADVFSASIETILDQMTEYGTDTMENLGIRSWDIFWAAHLPGLAKRKIENMVYPEDEHDRAPFWSCYTYHSTAQLLILTFTFLCFYEKQRRLAKMSNPIRLSQLIEGCLLFFRLYVEGTRKFYHTIFPLGQKFSSRVSHWHFQDIFKLIFLLFAPLGLLHFKGIAGIIEWAFILETIDIILVMIVLSFDLKDLHLVSVLRIDSLGIMNSHHNHPFLASLSLPYLIGFMYFVYQAFEIDGTPYDFNRVDVVILPAKLRFALSVVGIVLNGTLAFYLLAEPSVGFLTAPTAVAPPSTSPEFCSACSEILDAIARGKVGSGKHHGSKYSLQSAAMNGCRICSTVWHSRTRIPKHYTGSLFRYFRLKPVTAFDIESKTSFRIISEENRNPDINSSRFRIVDLQDHEGFAVPRGDHTKSGLELASTWLQNCLEHKCHTPDRTFTPTRLLYLKHDKVYLRFGPEIYPETKYATLSHCWGDKIPMKLLAESHYDVPFGHTVFQKHPWVFRKLIGALNNMGFTFIFGKEQPPTLGILTEGISVDELPQTFRDAITITSKLGLNFLWIDSLCIIQDSKEDWESESVRMGNVYQNSTCNIAALDATNSTEGCLYSRNSGNNPPVLIGPEKLLVHDFSVPTHKLSTRAWVLQEMILAPRTLDCGREGLSWRCSKISATEIYPGGNAAEFSYLNHPASAFKLDLDKRDFRILNTQNLSLHLKSEELQDYLRKPWINSTINRSLFEHSFLRSFMLIDNKGDSHPFGIWARIVEKYAEMGLTMAADRPVAILGIVHMLEPFFNKYLAGLWLDFLPLELLWRVKTQKRKVVDIQYPTWSWLSAAGTISYDWCRWDPRVNEILTEMCPVSPSSPIEQLHSANLKPGRSELKLRGRLLRATWGLSWEEAGNQSFQLDTIEEQDQLHRIFGVSVSSEGFGNIWFDDRSGPKPPEDIVCFPLISEEYKMSGQSSSEEGHINGLVLVPLAGRVGAYERIGVFSISDLGFKSGRVIVYGAAIEDVILI